MRVYFAVREMLEDWWWGDYAPSNPEMEVNETQMEFVESMLVPIAELTFRTGVIVDLVPRNAIGANRRAQRAAGRDISRDETLEMDMVW